MPDLHSLNIATHILSGSLTLLVGLFILSRPKGTQSHRRTGWVAYGLIGLCTLCALIGAFLFRSKLDLMGVSVLVAYQMWASFRALKLKNRGRNLPDLGPAVGLLALSGVTFWLIQQGGDVNWAQPLVYATLGSMTLYGGWDVGRTLLPQSFRRWLNPAEHAFRMTGLIGVLASVAAGTFWPVSYVPLGIVGVATCVSLVFAVRAARKALGVTPSVALNVRLKADSEL